VSRGKTGIGVDARGRSVVAATVRREGRKTVLVDVQAFDTPQLLERGSYRDAQHVAAPISRVVEGHLAHEPVIALGAVRSRTPVITVPLRGLNRQKAARVITAQAPQHFPNPGDITLAVDTAHLPVKERRGKTPNRDWLAAATPNDNLKTIAKIERSVGRAVNRVEPKALATLRAARGRVTQPGDHLVLGGADDGGDLTIVLDGTVHLVRLLAPDLERDVIPELAKTLDYLRSEGRETPTLHLAAHQQHADRLAQALEVETSPVTPWDDLEVSDAIDPHLLGDAVTAIGLALGALDPGAPDLNLKPAARRAAAHATATAPRGDLLQAASLALVVAAGAYHFLTARAVDNLRGEVRELEAQLLTGGSPERRHVERLQAAIDETLRHEALVHDLEARRLKPTEHVTRVVAALPSAANAATGQGLRFESLALRATDTPPPAHQPLPPGTRPATLVTITGAAPDTLTLEEDMRAVEADPRLRGYVRYANRADPNDPNDATVNTQIEILTLHPQPAEDDLAAAAPPLEELP